MDRTLGSRIVTRALVIGAALGVGALLAGCEFIPPLELVVTTTADGSDASPGDGVCEMNSGMGDCSLRAAIDEANAADNNVVITLAAGETYPLTAAAADDTNAGGDLDIVADGRSIKVVAPQPGATVDAAGGDHAIDVRAGHVHVEGVGATGAAGNGWVVRDGGSMMAQQASVHGNGGAGLSIAGGATAVAVNVTVTGNGAGGVSVDGTLVAGFVTITANDGGGIAGSGLIALQGSVVATQASGADCTSPVDISGGDLDSDGSCGLDEPTDRSAVDPMLGPASGTINPVHEPLAGSPLIDGVDVGSTACSEHAFYAVDELGGARPSGMGCDIGAIELQALELHVDLATDAVDLVPGDGSCTTALGGCTMRAAVGEANASPTADTIVIDPGVDPTASLNGHEDANVNGDLDVYGSVHIVGSGQTLSGGVRDRTIDHHEGHLVIEDLTITGGLMIGAFPDPSPPGGGLRSSDDVTLERVTFIFNATEGGGGAIAHVEGVLRMVDSTVDTNDGGPTANPVEPVPASVGGGLLVLGGEAVVERSAFTFNAANYGSAIGVVGGAVRIEQSTIAKNFTHSHVEICVPFCFPTPVDNKGAIYTAGGTTELAAVTIADNSAAAKSGIFVAAGTVSMRGTVLENAGDDCSGAVVSLGYNVDDDATCVLTAPGDQSGVAALLEPLGDNGGLTETMLAGVGSVLIDAVPAGTAGLCDASAPVDQRGVVRPQGSACDIGATEQ